MDCSECLRSMTGFLEGDLPPRTRELVSSHLDTCPNCRTRFEQVSFLVKELGDEERVKLPPYFLSKLSHALDEAQGIPARRKLVPKLVLGLTSLLVIVLAVLTLRPRRPASDTASKEVRISGETLYLSPSELEEGGEAFAIRGRSLNGDSVLYLLPSSPPKVKASLTSY